MPSDENMKLKKFEDRLKEMIKGTKEIKVNDRMITRFCKLIDANNLIYFDEKAALVAGFKGRVIPPEFIMNLTNPATQQIFIKGGPDFFPGLVKGVIHVGSTIKFLVPMIINEKYKIKTDITKPVKKKGLKGTYYSVTFKLSILNEAETIIHATDDHQFFLKLK